MTSEPRLFQLRTRLKRLSTIHRQGGAPNFFIFSTPRSGSTWLVEMLATQGRYKIVNEPFNLRKPVVRDNLQLNDWSSLFDPRNRELIRSYIQSFIDGKDNDLRFKREKPFTEFWHARTERIIFKILFAGEDSIHWFQTAFRAEIVLLFRHPIPVALSREELPRLNSFLAPPYSENFSLAQLRHAQTILNSNDQLQIGVLDWCLQNSVPLRHAREDWTMISYEQLVLDPELIVRHLADRFGLPSPDKMLRRVYMASRSTGKSSLASQDVLRDEAEIRKKRIWLIEKWRDRISASQEGLAFETMDAFNIKLYAPGSSLPRPEFLLKTP